MSRNNENSISIEDEIVERVKQINTDKPLQYIINLLKPYALEKIGQNILQCNKCSICNVGTHSLPMGDIVSPVLVIGEFPKQDALNHTYNYGDILNGYFIHVLKTYNVDYNKLYYCNCIGCVPCSNNKQRLPLRTELDTCYEYIVSDIIMAMQPKAILLLGNVPSKMFLGNSLLETRGEWHYINNIPTISTFHPDYFIQMQNIKNEDTLNNEYNLFSSDIHILINYIQSLGYTLI